MKKLLLIIVAALFVLTSHAQTMEKGDMSANFGLGLPSYLLGKGYSTSLPTIIFSVDKGVTDKIGIGYISGGVQFSMAGSKYVFIAGGVESKQTHFYTTTGPRAAYHFDFVEITDNEAFGDFDIYAGVFAGLTFDSYKYKIDGIKQGSSNVSAGFDHNLFVGARYLFAGQLGVYVEAGYGVSYLNGGLTWKF